MASLVLFLSSLAILSAIGGIEGVEYSVTNTAASTAGGARFVRDIGVPYTLHTMNASTAFIWRTFQQNIASDRRNVPKVSLFVDDMDGVAYASYKQIYVSARYIQGYGGDVKREFSGVLYHEMTHVWQWNGHRQAPGGLIEGIEDYVMLKAGYAPSHWVKPGQGDRWDQGRSQTFGSGGSQIDDAEPGQHCRRGGVTVGAWSESFGRRAAVLVARCLSGGGLVATEEEWRRD